MLFLWRRDFSEYLPETESPPQLSGEGYFVTSQDVAVPYWPTDVCGFGTNKICVAGKTSLGKTRIQVWTLNDSESLGDPYEDAQGKIHYPPTTIPVQSMTNGYDQTNNKLVRLMFRNHGSPNNLFVQLDDKDLDTQTAQWTTVLTKTQQPMLVTAFDDRWTANHTLGYMYILGAPGPGTLILFDTNRDGTLDLGDTRALTTGAEWSNGPTNFSDAAGYIKIY